MGKTKDTLTVCTSDCTVKTECPHSCNMYHSAVLADDKHENILNINLQADKILSILHQLSHANCVHIWNINLTESDCSVAVGDSDVAGPGPRTLSVQRCPAARSPSVPPLSWWVEC